MDRPAVLFALVAIVATLQIPLVIATGEALEHVISRGNSAMRQPYLVAGSLCLVQILWIVYGLLAAVGFFPMPGWVYAALVLIGIGLICASLCLCFWLTLTSVGERERQAVTTKEGK